MTTFTSSKFRSKEAAAILRAEVAGHSDFSLNRWSKVATEDLSRFIHLKDSKNGNERRTWSNAHRAVREGVEFFAGVFYPDCKTFDDRRNSPNASAYWEFIGVRLKDIIDMASLEAVTA